MRAVLCGLCIRAVVRVQAVNDFPQEVYDFTKPVNNTAPTMPMSRISGASGLCWGMNARNAVARRMTNTSRKLSNLQCDFFRFIMYTPLY